MRFGILTYHRAINMGSIVQAYCLQKKLKAEFPDAQVEVIDYRPGKWDYRESTRYLAKHWPYFSPDRYAEVKSIRRFARSVLSLSSHQITSRHLERSRKWLEKQEYDAIFVGSDTVWEYRSDAYSPANVNEFHLPWPMRAKKFSFAASADPVPPHGVSNPEHRTSIAKAISDFDVIGVRDEATIQLLRGIGVRTEDIQKTFDPTFYVDFSELAERYEIDTLNGRPLAGIAAPASVASKIAEVLRARGFAVWNWGNSPRDWADGHLSRTMTASQVLGAYRNLSTFVTDRFHGSIFTLRIGGVMPIFIETHEKWGVANSKGRELYEELGISDRVLRNDQVDWTERLGELAADSKAAPIYKVRDADGYFAMVREAIRA